MTWMNRMTGAMRVRSLCGAVACLLAAASASVAQASAKLPLSHSGRWITDAQGRVVVLHGTNMVYKLAPYYPSAIRFGLKGKGNFTGVDGEDITFGPGDMVLTPNDTWHNHGTVGNEQALNLSVLDLPLVETLAF